MVKHIDDVVKSGVFRFHFFCAVIVELIRCYGVLFFFSISNRASLRCFADSERYLLIFGYFLLDVRVDAGGLFKIINITVIIFFNAR
jgi:hypothetical protein